MAGDGKLNNFNSKMSKQMITVQGRLLDGPDILYRWAESAESATVSCNLVTLLQHVRSRPGRRSGNSLNSHKSW